MIARFTCCAVVALFVLASRADAQEEDESLSGKSFNIDLVTGPVLGSGRIIGLGGAYTALAYGADGATWTPTTYATRTLWETDWFEWDLAFDYNSPSTFGNTDFDNNGESGFHYNDFLFVTLGARFVFGAFGFGGLARVQDYRLGNDANLELIVGNYGASYAFLEGQLLLGLAIRTATLDIRDNADTSLASFTGSGPELGALVAPADKPFRIGLAGRLAVPAEKKGNERLAVGLTLPQELILPAEIQLGFAYQLGKRPLNRRFDNPEDLEDKLRNEMLARRAQRQRDQSVREAYVARHATFSFVPTPLGARRAPIEDDALKMPKDSEWWSEELRLRSIENKELMASIDAAEGQRDAQVAALPRQYLLLSTEVVLTGTTDDAVGMESFLSQRRQVSGRNLSLGFRLGAEGEPIEGRWKIRLGTYLEPSRFSGVPYRAHGTIDTDVRLFRWDAFGIVDPFDLRVGASFDLAVRYSNFGVGVGIWH